MSTVNGIGTSFVGECGHEKDGSYISTRWFTFVYVPVIPLFSARIHGQSEGKLTPVGLSWATDYEELPLHMPQVLRTYGYLALMVLLLLMVPKISDWNLNPLIIFPIGAAAAALPWFLRRRARKQAWG